MISPRLGQKYSYKMLLFPFPPAAAIFGLSPRLLRGTINKRMVDPPSIPCHPPSEQSGGSTMYNHISGLDHVVVAVRDLARAVETFERLGFATTPRGHHPEWGTANHCLMFAEDYIELLAAEVPGPEAEEIYRQTQTREGAVSLSLATTNGAACAQALKQAGMATDAPRSLSRRLDTPEGTTLMFSEIALPEAAGLGVETRLVQHITQQRLRFPDWLAHPNGARGIVSVTAVVNDPLALAPAWDRLCGPHAATPTDNTLTVHTGHGLLFLTEPEELTQLHPEAELDPPPRPPAIIALAIRVEDTDRAARLLRQNNVPHTADTEGTLRIAPSEACGLFLELTGPRRPQHA
jgi:hypothetical protein